jgi:TolB protein
MAVDGNTDIYISDAGGGFPRRLTTAPGVDTSPSFSPDGSKLAYLSWRSGVVVVNGDGSNPKTVGDGWWGTPSVSWLKDGQWLLLPDAGTFKIVNATSGERIYIPRTGFMYEPSVRP